MNLLARHGIEFSSSFSTWALSLTAVVCAAGVGYWNWAGSQYRRGVLLLEILRFTIVALIAVMLHQPDWVQIQSSQAKAKIHILVDRSKSMSTADVRGTEESLISRSEAVAPLASPEAWASLNERFDVRVETFPPEDESPNSSPDPVAAAVANRTDLSAALERAMEDADLQGVVLVSDGDWNQGASPIETATRFRAHQRPIFTVTVGSESRLPDLDIVYADVPVFGVVDKSVRIPFAIDSSLPREWSTTVTMEVSRRLDANDSAESSEIQPHESPSTVLSREIRIGAMGRSADTFVWTPERPGDYLVTLRVPPVSGEAILENNESSAPISIREEKLKVLLIETFPRWEYRYLRNALSRDPGVDLSCLLLHPNLEKVGGGGMDYLSEFPSDNEQLSAYDVIFLGDIGVGEKQLSAVECDRIRGLVEYQASGLVLLPGINGYQSTLHETSLEPLIPVVFDTAYPQGVGEQRAMHFELTESGRRSLLTKLAETDEDNSELWSRLPGFQWYASSQRAKSGAETLAVHQAVLNEYGRVPLIVTKTFGAGKVLFMATDGVWRWRRGVEDKYHYRFWGQVVRWMAYQRNMAKGENIRFYYSPESPQVGQTLSLKANVMNDAGEPLSDGDVSAKITTSSGIVSVVQMKSAGADSWGLYEGTFQTAEPGPHRVHLAAREVENGLDAEFFVHGTLDEPVGLPAKPGILKEISRLTRAKSVDLSDWKTLEDVVLNVPTRPDSVVRTSLWSHPVTLAIIIGLLTLFWVGRKWAGLL